MVKIAWSKRYAHTLPEGHRFPMVKYELIPEQLIYEGSIHESQLFAPQAMEEDAILLVHDQQYWNKLKTISLNASEVRKTGFPLSEELVLRETEIMQGTLECALHALQYGIALNVAGGTHHAFANRGEGFCLLNDMALAARYLLVNQLASKILVVDLDVHQGNGTASIFSDDPSVFTFSMHGKNNYPLHKERSNLDIELPDGADDACYLGLLEENIYSLMDDVAPDFIFYQCGVDILKTDALGKLAVSMEGCASRDRMVLELCKKNRIPVCCSMGGGYSPDIRNIVEAHCNTFRIAMDLYT